jgi:spore coat polysaccharide biosynthesis predicted glycosyltransferase SpsG
MKRKTDILIYTEGGHKLGMGNIYRSISLANELKKRGGKNVKFITTSNEKYVLDLIRQHKYPSLYYTKKKLLNKIIELDPKILIIDFLGLDESFVKEIKEKTNSKIVIIGNDTSANKYADIVINAIVGTKFKNKKHYINKTLYLEGPKYLVLRDEFAKKSLNYIYRGKLERVLLLFGGSDQANFTCKIFNDLLNYDKKLKLTLVIGAGFKYEKELNELIKKHPNAIVKLYKNISNVSTVMLKSDFIITSPGTALFEGFRLKIPILGLFQNHSQEKVFRNFFMTKKYQNIDNIGKLVNSIYINIDKYKAGINLIQAGEGKDEIINSILKL